MTTAIELTAIGDSVAPEPQTVSTEQWIGFFAMVFGIFMAILDIQIVASSLTQIQAGSRRPWMKSPGADSLPGGGSGDHSAVRLAGAGVFHAYFVRAVLRRFTLMSLCCVFAWNLPSMVVFRAFQGLFGGAMIPTVLR